MLPRITVPLLAAAVVFFACGPRSPNAIATARPRATAGKGVVSHVVVDTTHGKVRFAIQVNALKSAQQPPIIGRTDTVSAHDEGAAAQQETARDRQIRRGRLRREIFS